MNALLFLAEESPGWLRDLLQPQVMSLMLGFFGIVGGIGFSMLKVIIRHRERMAKIEHGIDPDADVKR